MIKSNGGIIGPDNVTTGGAFGSASGVFKLGEVTDLIKESKWPTAGPQGYQVANSCRFNRGSSDKLARTPGSASNKRTWTWSGWIKRGVLGVQSNDIFNAYNASGFWERFYFNSSDILEYDNDVAGTDWTLQSQQVFRDPNAWYHMCFAKDTTQGTEADRLKIYVNGVQIALNEVANGYPSQNYEGYINDTLPTTLGSLNNDSYYDGYMSEVTFIDGQQLAPTSFGEFNSQTGIWVPKVVTGLTFGTNGFYLPFTNSGALGEDFSGNDNDFTVTNLTSLDQSTDTCSTNFATLNSIDKGYGTTVFTEGNLNATSSSGWNPARGTIAVTSGKWYWETMSGNTFQIGVCSDTIDFANNDNSQDLTGVTVFYNGSGGIIRTNGSTVGSTTATFSASDTAGFALDMDNKKLSVYKNGSIIVTNTALSTSITDVAMIFGTTNGGGDFKINFGSPMYAISSGNTDGNGFGNFEYAPPSGYLSLNTKNLAVVLA